MSSRAKAAILVFSFAIVLFAVVGGLGVKASTNDGAYRQLGVYSEVLSRIRSEYVEEPNIPQVTDGALQVHGGIGYWSTSPIERVYRDARAQRFEEGTAEIQKTTIARDLLKR